MEENSMTAPAAENTEKKLSSGKVSIVLVLLALLIGFAAGRFGSILLPEGAEETTTVYRVTELRCCEEEGGEPTFVRTSEYDENGRELSCTFVRDGAVAERYLYAYDANGNMLEETYYEADGVVSYHCEHTYDGENRETAYREYGYDDEFTSALENRYDDEGNLTECISYDADGKVNSRTAFTTQENTDGSRTESAISYDESGTVMYGSICTYDAAGYATREQYLYEDGTMSIYEYDYMPFEVPVSEAENY